MSQLHSHDAARSAALRAALTGALLAGVLTLAACTGDPSATPTETTTVTTTATPTEQAPVPDGECSGLTGEEAAQQWAGEVPPPQTDPSWVWDVEGALVDGYDECAPLSWIVLPIEGATASSPFQIMLFHEGQYLGTATEQAYAFEPVVEQTSETQLTVTYSWLEDGDANAAPSGSSTAMFSWDSEAGAVVQTGDLPPDGESEPEPPAIPSACEPLLTEDLRAELAEYPLTETPSFDNLECQWAPEGADTTSLYTVITRVNDDEASGTMESLRTDEGFDCSEQQGGTRCEKTWQNEDYPVTDGRTVFHRDTVLIDTKYSNLAPEGYTDSLVTSIFGTS
jgi:hypothetical protein